MIRLAWSRLRYRPARGLAVALLAAALGVLAAPSALFVVACALYLSAAAALGEVRPALRTPALLGWERRTLVGAVLAEYGALGVAAAIAAMPVATFGDAEVGAGPAAAIAFAIVLAAGAARAATAASLSADPDGSRMPS